jgi:molecular chaperone DnaK
MPSEVKAKVESAANALDEAIKSGNHGDIKAKMEALNNAWNEASTRMYEATRGQQAGAGPQAEGPSAGQAPGEQQQGGDKGKKVEDADYEVVDDK